MKYHKAFFFTLGSFHMHLLCVGGNSWGKYCQWWCISLWSSVWDPDPYTSLPVSGQKEPACRATHVPSHVREHGHESFPWSTKISCIDLEIGTGSNLAFDKTLFGWDVFMYFTKINFCKLWFKKKNLRITWTPAFHPAPLTQIQSTPRCPVSSALPEHPSACLRRHQLLHRVTDTLLLLSVPALRVTSPSSSIPARVIISKNKSDRAIILFKIS